MLYLEKNPYVWDTASKQLTSPVMEISLKDKNNSVVSLKNMSDPVTVSLSSSGKRKIEIYNTVHSFREEG